MSKRQVEFLYLSQEDVIAAGGLDMAATMQAVEKAFFLHGRGEIVQPLKVVLRWGPPETEETTGRIMAMPSYLGGDFHVAGIKWIPSKPGNPRRFGLPRASALIILNDPETGLPLAIMDGTVISAMRTGAATGVAAKYLARPDSEVIGLVGAGVQGRTQLMALNQVLKKVKEVRVCDLDQEKAVRFAHEVGDQLHLNIKPVANPKEAIVGADTFVTATVGTRAYVERDWIGEGAFHAEISFWDTKPEALQAYDKIVVDDWNQVEHHGVDVSFRAVAAGLIPRTAIYGELGEIVCGKKPGRQTAQERILFNPIGMSINDIAEAYRIYRNAVERGIGQRLRLWESPIWV
jgi:ornithine cyclodeaminase